MYATLIVGVDYYINGFKLEKGVEVKVDKKTAEALKDEPQVSLSTKPTQDDGEGQSDGEGQE
jgi:hypothetical protein